MTWRLVEPCAGSAAFTLHMLGAHRALVPYQGSKWRFRRELRALAVELGFHGTPAEVLLTDPGPWGRVLGQVLDYESRRGLIRRLEDLSTKDPEAVFVRLQGGPVPTDDAVYAAEYLFLQRLAFSGKAVGVVDECWASPGFNRTSAYGVPATPRFGAVHPMIPSLIRTLSEYELHPVEHHVVQQSVALPVGVDGPRTLVYLDPPYESTTSYPNGQLGRPRVLELAQAWRAAGAVVIISEQCAIPLDGWRSRRLGIRSDESPFRGKQAEWVTFT